MNARHSIYELVGHLSVKHLSLPNQFFEIIVNMFVKVLSIMIHYPMTAF